MRALPAAAGDLSGLTNDERLALQYVAQGLSPRAIAERVDLSEEHVYQLVARVLDELEPPRTG